MKKTKEKTRPRQHPLVRAHYSCGRLTPTTTDSFVVSVAIAGAAAVAAASMTTLAASSAWVTSRTRSTASSMPTDRRTMPARPRSDSDGAWPKTRAQNQTHSSKR